jgi:hypothetical protein
MDNLDVEKNIAAIRHMLAWITAIVVIGAFCIIGLAAGYYVQQGREQVHNDVAYCIEHPGVC